MVVQKKVECNNKMTLKRLLLRLPVINVFFFALMPKTAYKEYLMWVLEEEGLTLEEIWSVLSEKDQKALRDFGVEPGSENISVDIKDDRDSGQQPDRRNQEEASDRGDSNGESVNPSGTA